jgi:hypothetical protein
VVVAVSGPSAWPVQAQSNAAPTFSRDVAPIFYKNCVGCHRAGDMAPMSLMTYDEARPWARSIRNRVAEGTMPPWHAEAAPGTFRNERRLTQAEKDTIVAWASNGAPQGDPRDLPAPPKFADGWTIGTPDAVVTMPRPFKVAASGTIAYQVFRTPTNFTEDKWVQAIELKPGARSVVHHILAFASQPDGTAVSPAPYRPLPAAGNLLAAPSRARAGAGAARAAALGARARQGRGRDGANGNLIASTAPGMNAQVFPPGHAMRIPKGAVITFQMHYTASGTETVDQSSIGFVFAEEPPAREVHSSQFVNAQLLIPAGAPNELVESGIEFTADAHVVALFPHTHLRGKSWQYRLVHPDGREDVILDLPRYDFNWQAFYEFATPVAVPRGSKIIARARYDNSPGNKANPDPSIAVRWGQQSWEEMQYTGITYVVDGEAPAGRSTGH